MTIKESYKRQHATFKMFKIPSLLVERKPKQIIVIYTPHWTLEEEPTEIQTIALLAETLKIPLILLGTEEGLKTIPDKTFIKKITGDVHTQAPWLKLFDNVGKDSWAYINGFGGVIQTLRDANECLSMGINVLALISSRNTKVEGLEIVEVLKGGRGSSMRVVEWRIKTKHKRKYSRHQKSGTSCSMTQ